MYEPFQIFVKPVGPVCNLACDYCYYLDKKSLYPDAGSFRMNEQILENYIFQHIEASCERTIMFSWHGGEPLLAGIHFFREAVGLQKKFRPPDSVIINGIQTNGTLIDDEWCRLFSDEHFIVGISLDGPEPYHGRLRKDAGGRSSFGNVIKGLELLKKYRISYEILCVVSSFNSPFPLEVYRFFRNLDAEFITFLPLVIKVPGTKSQVTDNSVKPGGFGDFLVAVFDEWLEHDIGRVKIQIVEEALRTAFGQDHTLCIFKETCGRVPVIEQNGDFYSCDHFVDPSHLIGNIMQGKLEELMENGRQIAFGKGKYSTLPGYCRKCEVLKMCHGECPKNRFIMTPDGEEGLNYLCAGYRKFFKHCRPFIQSVAEIWSARE
jgi:uncharacterized protein